MGKTIIVSNRLPLQIKITGEALEVIPSVGGLATGLKSFHKEGGSIWIGWTGLSSEDVPITMETEILDKIRKEQCVPVQLDQNEIEGFYYGFSNRTIWPLFHYFMEYCEFDADHWAAYKKVNEKYLEVVLEHLQDDDQIWIHDYQLLLLPNLIRKSRKNVSIGFFNHIPFPSYEVFRTLPWREEILEGMLGANLIGFHTYDYERHFLSSVNRILLKDVAFNEVNLGNRKVKVDSYPMGIDYEKFHQAAKKTSKLVGQENSDFQQKLEYHRSSTNNAKLIISVDRLDYTKGIANRIRAFEYFLDRYPQYKERIRLIMLAVPSREDVPQYQLLKREIDELVGRVNGKFATVNWTPIWYFYRSMPFENLIDLYTSSDIALITPTRDGMNLVAKEYLASRTDHSGVLILSEMAGAAHELNEALIINPNNFDQIVETIKKAFEMPLEEQISRNKVLQRRLKRYTVERWANDFMKALADTRDTSKTYEAIEIDQEVSNKIIKKFNKAKNKILFLDYDGTLVNFVTNPRDATPDQELLNLIRKINEQANTRVVIISGRDKETLGSWWQEIPVQLISEHGVWMRPVSKDWALSENVKCDWMKTIRPVLETFVDRTPGTFIEEKNYSLAWHYRKTDPDLGAIRANELSTVLKDLIANHGLSVLQGNKVLEIKSSDVNKGKAANKLLIDQNADFIFAIGDDWTDEFMFNELPHSAITIKVGIKKTDAKYFIQDTQQVRELLKKFIEL